MEEQLHRQLFLVPVDMAWHVEQHSLFREKLLQLGLISTPLHKETDEMFLVGDRFLQYFSFMGCSPAVEFAPADDGEMDPQNLVYIHIPATLNTPRWLADNQTAKPACPSCQKRTREWQEEYGNIVCPHCGTVSPLCTWNWYDSGGCAVQFISIVNVYPREAIPSDNFMQLLMKTTSVMWRHFYVNAPLIGS